MANGPLSAAHSSATEDVARALGVAVSDGLSDGEARLRLERNGPNALEEHQPPSIARTVLKAAREPFVLLLAAAGIGAVVLGELRDGLLVLGGLIPIVGADVATAYRSERAMTELRRAVAPRAQVLRAGRRVEVPAAEIVVGDVLLLGVGDVVPADARVLPGGSLLVDRSILTGESVPERVSPLPDRPDADLAERHAMVYAGTSVVGGRGAALTVATGAATELGAIAGSLGNGPRRRSPLQRELDRLVRILLVAAIGLIAVTVGLGFLRGQPAGANLLAGISAAIAAVPEEPPVLLAVILGLGAYRLMRRGVLVRRLSAQEALGAVDLIITDKTGTLTQNRLVVEGLLRPDGPVQPKAADAYLLEALAAEEDAWAPPAIGRRGSFTLAIEREIQSRGLTSDLDETSVLSAAGPADGRPYAMLRHARGDGWRELAFGAPEAVLGLDTAMAPTEREAWLQLIASEATRGGRLLLLAVRDDGRPWRLRALVRFGDALRPEVAEAVATATEAGIQTIMVTGDHPATAAATADVAGLPPGRALTGHDLERLSDEELVRLLPDLRIVSRAIPVHKLRLVQIAQAHGRSVAVTGDGVNDAPALQAADVAVAMGSGTAVAREASDLVLGDDSFATLMTGLREGRRIVANVQKGLVFLVSTHVALLGFILIATVAGFGQPLLPLQILWLELFIDLSASVAFEREAEEPDAMRIPPRPRNLPLLDRTTLVRIAAAGGFSAVGAFVVLVAHPGDFEHARWLAFTVLVVGQCMRAYGNRSLRRPLGQLRPNWFLAAACLVAIGIQIVIPMVPALATAFHAEPLSAMEWLIVAAIALAPALVAELVRGQGTGRTWIA